MKVGDKQAKEMLHGMNVRFGTHLDVSDSAVKICCDMWSRAGLTYENAKETFDGFTDAWDPSKRKPCPQDLAIHARRTIRRETKPDLPPKHERCSLCGSDGYMPVLVPVDRVAGKPDWECEAFRPPEIWNKGPVYRFVVPCACSAGQRIRALAPNEEAAKRGDFMRKLWMDAFELQDKFNRLAPMISHYERENFEATPTAGMPEDAETERPWKPTTAREQKRLLGDAVLAEGKRELSEEVGDGRGTLPTT